MLKNAQVDTNGWPRWSKHVLLSIQELDGKVELLQGTQTQIRIDLAVLKREMSLKSGVWGLLGGFVPVAIMVILWLIRSG